MGRSGGGVCGLWSLAFVLPPKAHTGICGVSWDGVTLLAGNTCSVEQTAQFRMKVGTLAAKPA